MKERKRRMDLAAFRDRLRRRKLADGEPIPEDLKEQEWERVLARTQVCVCVHVRGRVSCGCPCVAAIQTPGPPPPTLPPPPPTLPSPPAVYVATHSRCFTVGMPSHSVAWVMLSPLMVRFWVWVFCMWLPGPQGHQLQAHPARPGGRGPQGARPGQCHHPGRHPGLRGRPAECLGPHPGRQGAVAAVSSPGRGVRGVGVGHGKGPFA